MDQQNSCNAFDTVTAHKCVCTLQCTCMQTVATNSLHGISVTKPQVTTPAVTAISAIYLVLNYFVL